MAQHRRHLSTIGGEIMALKSLSIRTTGVLCVTMWLGLALMTAKAQAASNVADLGGKALTHMIFDGARNVLCATATTSDSVLFIDAATMTVTKTLYVGKNPYDLDIDITGNILYVSSD